MTVQELIDALSKYPGSSLIVFVDDAPIEGQYDAVRLEAHDDEVFVIVE